MEVKKCKEVKENVVENGIMEKRNQRVVSGIERGDGTIAPSPVECATVTSAPVSESKSREANRYIFYPP